MTDTDTYVPRLKEHYLAQLRQSLTDDFGYKNPMQVPRLEKIVVNMGVGEAAVDSKRIGGAVNDMTLITGQKPVVTRAKLSIAVFKLREGMPIGCMVTLRNKKMWNFLDKLLHIAMPRIRDFRGISPRAFDGFGNYNIGIKEQLIFPEIEFDDVDHVRGMNVSIVTSAKTDEESMTMIQNLGFPFRK